MAGSSAAAAGCQAAHLGNTGNPPPSGPPRYGSITGRRPGRDLPRRPGRDLRESTARKEPEPGEGQVARAVGVASGKWGRMGPLAECLSIRAEPSDRMDEPSARMNEPSARMDEPSARMDEPSARASRSGRKSNGPRMSKVARRKAVATKWSALSKVVKQGASLRSLRAESSATHQAQEWQTPDDVVTEETSQVVDYRHQGDAEMYSVGKLKARNKLRWDPEVLERLQTWWACAQHTMQTEAHDESAIEITREQYVGMFRLVFKVMLEDLEPEEAVGAAHEEWAHDSRGAASMGREQLMDSLFELARRPARPTAPRALARPAAHPPPPRGPTAPPSAAGGRVDAQRGGGRVRRVPPPPLLRGGRARPRSRGPAPLADGGRLQPELQVRGGRGKRRRRRRRRR